MVALAERPLPPLRETDYLSRREPVQVPELGPDVTCWQAGPGVPPLFVERSGEALATLAAFDAWVAEKRTVLDDLIFRHGGILLRGFPTREAGDFERIIGHFPRYERGYVAGMTPRKAVQGDILESTRMDERVRIPMHSEMSYMKSYPPRLAFFCRQAPTSGGETIIGSMDEFMKRMPRELREKLEGHDTLNVRNYAAPGSNPPGVAIDHPDKITWDDGFFTADKAEVERIAADMGIQLFWNADNSLTLKDSSPVFQAHPRDGKVYYRTNLHANRVFEDEGYGASGSPAGAPREPTRSSLDTGEALTREEAGIIIDLYDQVELAWPWQDGDVMILDNLKVVHGRAPFSGPREVLVALLD